MKATQKEVKGFGGMIQRNSGQIKKMGLAITAMGTAALFAFKKMIDLYARTGDMIHKMALRTGFSAEALSELAHAAEISGTDLTTLEKGVKKMSKTLVDAARGLETYTISFERIGLNAEDLIKLSPEEQFEKITEAIAALESPTLRAATAQEIFGRAGTMLLPLMAEGKEGLRALREEAHALGKVYDEEAAAKAAELTDAQTRLKTSMQGVTIAIAENLVPIITELTKKATETIKRIREWIKEHPKLTGIITKFVPVMAALMVPLGALAMMLPGLVTGFALLKTAAIALTGPVGLAALALAGIALSIKEIIKTHKEAVKAMSDMALGTAIMGNAAENFKNLWITVRKEGGVALEQFNELMTRFGGNWDKILKQIIADPKLAVLKAMLLDVAKGIIKVDLEGKNLSITLPDSFLGIEKATEKTTKKFDLWATTVGKIFHDTSVRAAEMRGAIETKIKLPPIAVNIPKMSLEDFEEWYKKWEADLMADWPKTWKESFQLALADAAMFTSALGGLFNQMTENRIANIEKEYETRKAAIENSLMTEKSKTDAMEKLDKEFEKKRKKAMRAQAVRTKAVGIMEAIIHTASAIIEALPNIPLAIAVGIMGAVQTALIAAAPLPSFQRGGRIEEAGIVGEAGPEIFVPGRPGEIIPIRERARALGAQAVLTFNPTFYLSTLDPQTARDVVRDQVAPEMLEMFKTKILLPEFQTALGIR